MSKLLNLEQLEIGKIYKIPEPYSCWFGQEELIFMFLCLSNNKKDGLVLNQKGIMFAEFMKTMFEEYGVS